jgi:hypothetical protein
MPILPTIGAKLGTLPQLPGATHLDRRAGRRGAANAGDKGSRLLPRRPDANSVGLIDDAGR